MPSFTETMLQRYVRVTFEVEILKQQAADFKVATQHPFLVQAGKGTLNSQTLTEWCRQDCLYAFVGYIKVRPNLPLAHLENEAYRIKY
jgi:hypothetical protein